MFRTLNDRRKSPSRTQTTRLAFETLEARDVPAIVMVGTELRVTAGNANDSVTISFDDQGTSLVSDDKIVATRVERTPGPILTGIFTETKSFDASKVKSIRVTLGNGTNSFENQTAIKSVASGGSGRDEMTGGTGNDTLFGYGGDDLLAGGAGADILSGGIGNDTLSGDAGQDSLFGDAGNDALYGQALFATASTADSGNDLWGGEGNDTLRGTGGNDTLRGSNGDDQLVAGAGDDKIYADAGDDFASGGDGNDSIWGGIGNDKVEAGDGADSVWGGNDRDTINGGTGKDTLRGEAGNDTLDGGSEDDSLIGGTGDDSLTGGEGNDTLEGESGRDSLVGSGGSDVMKGGTGKDQIVAIDGSADIFFGATSLTNGERDDYWLDAVDSVVNGPQIAKANAIDPDSVHIVSNFRSYTVNGNAVSVGLAPNPGNLADPTRQSDDSGVLGNFRFLPVFGPGGPKYTDIDQGAVGSCYFLSRLASLAKSHPQYIRDMIVELGDGTYAVQFFNQEGEKVFVRVDADLWVNDGSLLYANASSDGALWVAIIEKAWAIHRYGTASYGDINGGNSDVNTSMAMGLNHTDHPTSGFGSATAFVNQVKSAWSSGKAVMICAPSSLNNNMYLTESNKADGGHVFMVHSVISDSTGKVKAIKLYNLYGNGLTEITNFDVLFWVASKSAVVWPK